MSALYRVTLDVTLRAKTEHEAIQLAQGIVSRDLLVEAVECVAADEIDETPTDAQMSSFYSQCEAGQSWQDRSMF